MQLTTHSHTVIVIAGPTGVGKTALSLQLAGHFGTSVISADSRQCFRELNIGVAKPALPELERIPHYFINSHSIEQEVNAAVFEQYALAAAANIFRTNSVAIMVGGTGMYIRAFCEGMDEIPVVPESVRRRVSEGYRLGGLDWLQQELQQQDAAFWQVAEQQNPQRLMRALEVWYATGQSILHFRKAQKAVRPFRIIPLALELPREQLHQRIHQRVDQMMNEGLLQEVQDLLPCRRLNALQTVGYQELFAFLDGKMNLPEAVAQLKTHTRQYAKRQMTWFKKDSSIRWFHPGEEQAILNFVQQRL